MDNREHPRYPAGVDAMVEHRRLGHLNAKIRDVSANGVFLELPERANLSEGRKAGVSFTPITVRYRLPQGPAGRTRVWRGYVARLGDSGLAASVSKIRPSGDPNLAMLVEYAKRGEIRRSASQSAV